MKYFYNYLIKKLIIQILEKFNLLKKKILYFNINNNYKFINYV